MTLFILEGPSASGKSTVRDELIEKNPTWIRWKGENIMRKGPGEHWIEYQRRYHEALHRLYELNPENIIIADRAFTDCVYNSDAQMREEMRRLAACYGNAHILYFYPGKFDASKFDKGHGADGQDVLMDRGTRDAYKLNDILERYTKLLSMFDHHHINTDVLDVEDAVDEAEQYIRVVHENYVHNPDV